MNQQSHCESVTRYLQEFKNGSLNAANKLVACYWPRVVAAASLHLNAAGIRLADQEDVAISVFDCLCREASQARFGDENLNDRMQFWRYLSLLIKRKAIDVVRKSNAIKRGSGKVVNETALIEGGMAAGLENFPDGSISPVQRAIQVESSTRFLESLQNDEIREIVVLYLEGWQQKEIAGKVGLCERTIRRKLDLARQTWAQLADEN